MPFTMFYYIFTHHVLVDVTGMICFADVVGLRDVCKLYWEALLSVVTSTSSLRADSAVRVKTYGNVGRAHSTCFVHFCE